MGTGTTTCGCGSGRVSSDCLCPLMPLTKLMGRHHALGLLSLIASHGTVRFGELASRLGDVSSSTVAARLADLREAGLVERTVYPRPPRVDYSLTRRGRELCRRLPGLFKVASAAAMRLPASTHGPRDQIGHRCRYVVGGGYLRLSSEFKVVGMLRGQHFGRALHVSMNDAGARLKSCSSLRSGVGRTRRRQTRADSSPTDCAVVPRLETIEKGLGGCPDIADQDCGGVGGSGAGSAMDHTTRGAKPKSYRPSCERSSSGLTRSWLRVYRGLARAKPRPYSSSPDEAPRRRPDPHSRWSRGLGVSFFDGPYILCRPFTRTRRPLRLLCYRRVGSGADVGESVRIRSRCHHCGEPLELPADPSGPGPGAEGVMVWAGKRCDGEERAWTST
jgi:DNA-binding HxlR family transcriptional regulator